MESSTPLSNVEREKQLPGPLVLFCIATVIIQPLLVLVELNNALDAVVAVSNQYPSLETLIWVETALIIGVYCYGFLIGLAIWRRRGDGKRRAERYLVIRLVMIVGGEIVLSAVRPNLPSALSNAINAALVFTLGKEVAFFFIWFLYFANSTRVRAFYERPSRVSAGALTRSQVRVLEAGATIELPPGTSISDDAWPALQVRRVNVIQGGTLLVSEGEPASGGDRISGFGNPA